MKRRFSEVKEPEELEPFSTTPPPPTFVRRVTAENLDAQIGWAVPLIQEMFGHPSRELIYRWARMWASENQYNFVYTNNGVALAVLSFEPCMPSAIVQEVFICVRPGNQFKHEGLKIYEHFATWAKTTQAGRFRFYDTLGAPMNEIRKLFPDLEEQKMWYVDF